MQGRLVGETGSRLAPIAAIIEGDNMHRSAYRLGKRFLELYIGRKPSRILDVGSLNVNGSLRDHAIVEYEYIGVDMAPGQGVDIVLDDGNILPFPDQDFDAIVTSSVFEHSVFFWLLFLEMARVCKSSGFIYVNAPTNGLFHQYPYDFWRFYPDAGVALASWATHHRYELTLLESGVAYKQDDIWNDFVAVFQKSVPATHRGPMIVDNAAQFMNIRRHDRGDIINRSEISEDQAALRSAPRKSAFRKRLRTGWRKLSNK